MHSYQAHISRHFIPHTHFNYIAWHQLGRWKTETISVSHHLGFIGRIRL